MKKITPVVLIVMDGFGMSPVIEGNAVYHAKTPTFEKLIASYPATLLHASGQEVGLEFGEIGNSEVGHLNLGTGRVVLQDLPRITQSIERGSFFKNKILVNACQYVNSNDSTLHLFGLTSNGGVHSHIDHLFALMELAKAQNVKKVAIHVITDRRDTPPKKALEFVKRIEKKIKDLQIGKIVTICGRFYAMDRDKHWLDRTKMAYELFVNGKGQEFESAVSAIESSYKNNETDENITPKIIDKNMTFGEQDAIIAYNFRIDRIQQMTQSIIDPNFKNFNREKFLKNLMFASFTSYGFEPTNMVKIAFFSEKSKFSLSEVLSNGNLNHFHIAETEKYAHVTYFFNGGTERPFLHENRLLVPSLRVTSYDQKPEMSAKEIANKFTAYFNAHEPDFSIINFANPDMVGHTGNFKAAISACEVVDKCLSEVVNNLLAKNVNIIVTADHGNAEQMINPETHDIDKEHTTNPVPMIIISSEKRPSKINKAEMSAMQPVAVLADVAPTILNLLNLDKPREMNGQSIKDFI